MTLTSKIIKKTNWLVAKTNQASKSKNFPRSVGVRRGGGHQPQQMTLTSKTINKTNWLVAKTNQAWKANALNRLRVGARNDDSPLG
jgi:hypothetical protein